MANEKPEEGTIFDKLMHLDMQLKEAELLHWSAAAAYDTAQKDGVNVEESKAVLLETTQAVTKLKSKKVNLVKEIDDLAKKNPKFMEEVNETISSCDIAMMVSMEHFTKTCAATSVLRQIVYDQRKGKISITRQPIDAIELPKYAKGITEFRFFQWCPICGSTRIEDAGTIYDTDKQGQGFLPIIGFDWHCFDCGEDWKHNWLTGKIEYAHGKGPEK